MWWKSQHCDQLTEGILEVDALNDQGWGTNYLLKWNILWGLSNKYDGLNQYFMLYHSIVSSVTSHLILEYFLLKQNALWTEELQCSKVHGHAPQEIVTWHEQNDDNLCKSGLFPAGHNQTCSYMPHCSLSESCMPQSKLLHVILYNNNSNGKHRTSFTV